MVKALEAGAGIRRSRRRGFSGWLSRLFRTRQIYLRSDGDVQFISLSPMTQGVMLIGLLVALFWTAYASINVAFKDQLLVIKEQNMAQARLDYEDRVAGLRLAIDALNGKLLLDQGAYLSKVDEVRADYNKLVQQHERLTGFFRQGFMPLRDQPLAPAAAAVQDVPAAQPGKSGLNDEPFAAKYQTAFSREQDALRPLDDLRQRYGDFEKMQIVLLQDARSLAGVKTAKAARIFAALGIDSNLVIAQSKQVPEAAGGPFVAASITEIGSAGVLRHMGNVASGFADFEKLKLAAAELPLFAPMRNIDHVSSGFGLRNDPLRRTPAMHGGVDFKGPWAEPVLATAHGTITRAGPSGAYGNLVEIAHDNGVSTRYAHLSAVSVSVGQRVERGDVVGRMGNSGRSTGPHLHYETRVEGRAIDPVRFWRTRDDLQALKEEEGQ